MRHLLIAVAMLTTVPSGAFSDPLCFDPKSSTPEDRKFAEEMEAVVSEAEVERAWRSLIPRPASEEEDQPGMETEPSKSPLGARAENAGLLWCGYLMQRAYRLRAELELAEKRTLTDGSVLSDIDARRKAFENAREAFCKFTGHGFIPEFRPGLGTRVEDPVSPQSAPSSATQRPR